MPTLQPINEWAGGAGGQGGEAVDDRFAQLGELDALTVESFEDGVGDGGLFGGQVEADGERLAAKFQAGAGGVNCPTWDI